MDKKKIFLELDGYPDELLYENGFLKMTRLVQDVKNESIDVTVESRNEQFTCAIGSSNDIDGDHPKFDELLGKKIKITVEIID